MTLKATILSDVSNVFLNTDEFADSAIWTPAGSVAQPAIIVFFMNTPRHGDEYSGVVSDSETYIVAASSDVSSWKKDDFVQVNGTDYQIVNAPYPESNDNVWSIVELRYPLGNEVDI